MKTPESNSTVAKYSALKLQELKMWLEDMAEGGQPKFYEVYVDDLKVVPKTSSIEALDKHTEYMDENTQRVTILVYNSEGSHRYHKTIYTIQEGSKEQALNGTEVERLLSAEREKWKSEALKDENERLKTELKESRDYADKLEEYVETLKQKAQSADGWKSVIDGMKDFAPLVIGGKPSAQPLSGKEEAKPKEEASFKMKGSEEESLSEPDKALLGFARDMRTVFSKEEFETVIDIIHALMDDRTKISTVADLLKESTKTKK